MSKNMSQDASTASHTTFSPRVFSGMQPTGNLHLGNYLGALRNFIELQETHECIYCVVDMHAITVWQDPDELRHNTREIAAAYMGAGLNPKKSIIFNQSRVPAHAQLAWLFNCIARIGWLNRMTQFKDKAGDNREKASTGLYVYPNLMAADILAYHGTHVPLGEDQKQHLELTRNIAIKFNNDFGINFFPVPEPIIMSEAARVMSLRDGRKKMSKSDPSHYSRITMMDDADTISQKIRKAKTDPEPMPETQDGLERRPEAQNLISIYAALLGQSTEQALSGVRGMGFRQFKKLMTDVAIEKLSPVGNEIRRLMADPEYIDDVLADGGNRAHAIAEPILTEAERIVGFLK